MSRFVIGIVLFIGLVCYSGCGGGAKKSGTVPAKLTVTQKGAPLSEAVVTLVSQNGQGASGVTNSSGVAVLNTEDGFPGVMPGEYSVTVSKFKVTVKPAAPTKDDPERTTITTTESLLHKKYRSPETSNLKVSITKENPNVSLDLKD